MIGSKKLFAALPAKLNECLAMVRQFMYGMTIYEVDLTLHRERENLEHLFMLVVFGDLIGLPVLPPQYSMRLLPHVLPVIEKWKKSVLRERDITDLGTMDF